VHKHFKDESVFAVSLNEQGYSWATAEFKNGYIRHQPGKETDKVHRTFWVSGGSGVFRRDYWMSLGGMDETLYKFYWEDMDLCYRAAKRGYNLLWDPDARVVHKHESSTSTSFTKRGLSDMQETNELLFHWKNITSNNLFRKHIAGMFRRAVRNPGYARIILRALMRFWKVRRARLKEKKECKVSDEAILSRFR
jgi:GT2 family glycosyltransferase